MRKLKVKIFGFICRRYGNRWYQAQLLIIYGVVFLSISLFVFSLHMTNDCVLPPMRQIKQLNTESSLDGYKDGIQTYTNLDLLAQCKYYVLRRKYREDVQNIIWKRLNVINLKLNDALHHTEKANVVEKIHSAQMFSRDISASLKPQVPLKKITQISSQTSRQQNNVTSVCPEIYRGESYGYPFFYTGFETQHCSYAKPLHKQISIVLTYNGVPINRFSILKEIDLYYPGVTVILTAGDDNISKLLTKLQLKSLQVVDNIAHLSSGEILNALVKRVKTPFVLVGRDLSKFTNDTRLERLVRELEFVNVSAVGGAERDASGRWLMGCSQMEFDGDGLSYISGYHQSMHECVFCDSLSSSFLARTKLLKQLPFAKNVNSAVMFEDWFLQLKNQERKSLVCPDSMFFSAMGQSPTNDDKLDWVKLFQKWNFSRVKLPSGKSVNYPCDTSLASVDNDVCKHKSLTRAINIVMDACEKSGIVCELQNSSVLAILKSGQPGRKDALIAFLMSKNVILKAMLNYLQKAGYIVKKNTPSGEHFLLTSSIGGWHISLSGVSSLDSSRLISQGSSPTKISLGGNLVNVRENPGSNLQRTSERRDGLLHSSHNQRRKHFS